MKTHSEQEILIRRARLEDAYNIHQAHQTSIQQICSQNYSSIEIQAWGGRDYNEEIRHQAITQDWIWVVEYQGYVEGFGHLHIGFGDKEGQGVIKGLYLTPAVVGRGLGRNLLLQMERVAKEQGVQTLNLESTLTAFEFYKYQGYREKGPQITVTIQGVSIRCHPMEKQIG